MGISIQNRNRFLMNDWRSTISDISAHIGLSPGSYKVIPTAREERAEITLFVYDESNIQCFEQLGADDLPHYMDQHGKKWILVNRIHDPKLLDWMKDDVGIDPMVLEDMVNTDVKPKFEDHDDYLFIIAKLPIISEGRLILDHVAIIVKEDVIVAMAESQADAFVPLIKRLKLPNGRIRAMGTGYMAYAILDLILDHFIVCCKTVEGRIELIDEELDDDSADEMVLEVNTQKRIVSLLRREVTPMVDVCSALRETESELIGDDIDIYLSDLADHAQYVVSSLDTSREALMDLHQLCLAITSNNMNNVMRVLTVVATIFIPLTFIAGIYGMNFVNMPELQWEWGYFYALGLMTAIAVIMLLTFRRRGWF